MKQEPNLFLKFKDQKGQILLEIILVVGIVAVVAVGLIKSLTTSLRNVQMIKQNTQAENYAKEAVEWLVYQRDNNWNNLQNHVDHTYCLNELIWLTSPGGCGGSVISGTVFSREVSLAVISSQEISVTINITWPSPRGGEKISIIQNLTKWR